MIETNLGITPDLRVLIPATKSPLLYGRTSNHLGERGTLALASALGRASTAFIDVGANEGIFTFSLASALQRGQSDRIHTFEPDPVLYDRLKANIRRAGYSCNIHNMAVSAQSGRATFHRNLSSDEAGSLTTHFVDVDNHETTAIEVETITLADYLSQQDLRGVCVKVDAEGAGVAVWEGMRPAIDRVDSLIIEVIRPEVEANLPARIIAETGLNGYYIRDRELIPSRHGEYTYVYPFYNWLFTRHDRAFLEKTIAGSGLRIVDKGH